MKLIFKLRFPLRATLVIVLILLNVAMAGADQLSSESDEENCTGENCAYITKTSSDSALSKGIASKLHVNTGMYACMDVDNVLY